MEVIIRIALMFFFIQFLVVMTIMAVALLLARPEVPALGRETGRQALSRSYAFVIHLPSRLYRSVARQVHFAHSVRSVN
jgi:type II secretory pathway pseudopilin PulG